MGFQSTINTELGFGLPGELFDNTPRRAAPWMLYTASHPEYNVPGRAFTATTADPGDGSASAAAAAGGTGVFVGLLANPKVNAGYGDSTGTLAASTALPNYAIGELVTMGHINVTVPGACSLGDQLTYNTTTGVLGTVTPSGSVTYSQSTTTLTVTAVTTGMNLGVGSVVNASTGPLTITALGTGTGGTGTYTVNASQTLSSESKIASSVAPSGYALITGSKIIRYAPSAASVAVASLT